MEKEVIDEFVEELEEVREECEMAPHVFQNYIKEGLIYREMECPALSNDQLKEVIALAMEMHDPVYTDNKKRKSTMETIALAAKKLGVLKEEYITKRR